MRPNSLPGGLARLDLCRFIIVFRQEQLESFLQRLNRIIDLHVHALLTQFAHRVEQLLNTVFQEVYVFFLICLRFWLWALHRHTDNTFERSLVGGLVLLGLIKSDLRT